MSDKMIGLTAEVKQVVSGDMLAASVGSGSVGVFATPELILLIEKAAVSALDGYLDEGRTTVGSGLKVTHLAATPLGMSVTGVATVTSVEGKKVTFEVSASDEQENIAKGTHTRYIVGAESFQARADSKNKS